MKPFQRDLAIVLLANLLSKPLWLIADNLAQNRIGHDAYGLVGALLGLGQWATAVADWGLYALVTREMARSQYNYSAVSQMTFLLKLLLTGAAAVLFIGLGWGIGYRGKALIWLIALISYQLALSYLQYFRAYFQGAQQFRIDAIFSAVEKLIVLLLFAFTWVILDGNLYVGILVTAGVLTATASGAVVWRRYGRFDLRVKRDILWHAFRQMTPFALMGYATAFNERLNQILLERWVSAHENGLYWGAYRWFSAAMMYLWIVLPMFFARFAKLGRVRSPELWRTFIWGQLVSSLPIIAAAGIFLGAPELFMMLFTDSTPAELTRMNHTLQALSFALVLNGLTAIYSTYLTAVGYEWQAFWLMVGASLINFLGCVFLLPMMGAIGAALALGLSYLFYGVGFVRLFRKVAPLPLPLSLLLRLILLTGIYGGSLWLLREKAPLWAMLLLAPPLLATGGAISGLLRYWRYAHRHR